MIVKIIFTIIGGLGMFLFGMKFLSEALRNASGERIKKILAFLTRNRVLGLLLGTGITALIQSSSATTVMTVGLINAGLLTLKQSLSVILGANIGTTLTAWIVASLTIFNVKHYALPAIGIGFFLLSYSKNIRWRQSGEVIFGFGLLFFGLLVMKDAAEPIASHPQIRSFFLLFSHYPILGVLAGTIFTVMVQSSSATVALVQALAWQGLIDFNAAVPLILGDNIGTTITAQIASVQANLTAKRAAMAHTLVNTIGVSYVMIFVYNGLFARLVQWLLPGELDKGNIMTHIALAHTVFNVFNACVIFIPLLNVLEKVLVKLMPSRAGEDPQHPQYLEPHLLEEPALALHQSKNEIIRMAQLAKSTINDALSGFFNKDMKVLSEVGSKEQALDRFQHEITSYLVDLSQRHLESEEAHQLPVLMHSVNDLERIGDHATNLVELAERHIRQNHILPKEALGELHEMSEEVNKMMDDVICALQNNDLRAAEQVLVRENTVNRQYQQLKQINLDRMNEQNCKPLAGMVFVDFINNIEKIGDHTTNIAEAVLRSYQWA
ncbi:Na/Pi cotransporter family protein [candidate division FCPU426 bacterium]|nr:Na/Pi cotransporter family protein [candidate division FCPU426 bacterium]